MVTPRSRSTTAASASALVAALSALIPSALYDADLDEGLTGMSDDTTSMCAALFGLAGFEVLAAADAGGELEAAGAR